MLENSLFSLYFTNEQTGMVPLAAVADVLGTSLDHVQVRLGVEEGEGERDGEERKRVELHFSS